MSEERSQNEQLMNYEEVKLNFFQNIILGLRVYFRLILPKYNVVFFIAFYALRQTPWVDNGRPLPVFLIYLVCALSGVAANLILFGLGPVVFDLIQKDLFPWLGEHIEEEKIKIQKASLEKIDDILLKK